MSVGEFYRNILGSELENGKLAKMAVIWPLDFEIQNSVRFVFFPTSNRGRSPKWQPDLADRSRLGVFWSNGNGNAEHPPGLLLKKKPGLHLSYTQTPIGNTHGSF